MVRFSEARYRFRVRREILLFLEREPFIVSVKGRIDRFLRKENARVRRRAKQMLSFFRWSTVVYIKEQSRMDLLIKVFLVLSRDSELPRNAQKPVQEKLEEKVQAR